MAAILTLTSTSLNPGNGSIAMSARLIIKGGTNNLGTYAAQRSPGGNNAAPALGTDGLVVSNGFVNATSMSVGNNAHGIIFVAGGIITNGGTLTIKNATATRPARLSRLAHSSPPIPMSSSCRERQHTVYAVLGGTNIVGGVMIGTTILFTNAANMCVGSAGISRTESRRPSPRC